MKRASRPSECGKVRRRRRRIINNGLFKKKLKNEIIWVRNKRKKCRGNNTDVNYAADPVSNSLVMDDSVVTYEILSRLPVKSLMQCKCVCKHWKSLIQEDPYFIHLHLNRSKTRPCLFTIHRFVDTSWCMRPEKDRRDPAMFSKFMRKNADNRKYFLSAELVEGRNGEVGITQTTTMKSSFSYDEVLKPVNGLICFIDMKAFAVRMYNVSTHELTRWVKTNNTSSAGPMYSFGYSPAAKEHKVICIWSRIESLSDVTCEVLTVGDSKWQGINSVPPCNIRDVDHVYANGSIYWCNLRHSKLYDVPEFIVAFDVGDEKFRTIHVPKLILNQLMNQFRYVPLLVDLVEIKGCLALKCRVNRSTVKLWIFSDDHDNKENITATGEGWTEESITLPRSWPVDWILDFHDIAGTDQILIESDRGNKKFTGHIYDRKKKTFK